MPTTFAEALAPLRAPLGAVVREREILRVCLALHAPDAPAAIESARREVLSWAQRRAGKRLPEVAWSGETFELPIGGRGLAALALRAGDARFWAFRGDDPDKTVPGRTWTTEVVIGLGAAAPARLAVRLLASSPEQQLDIVPAVQGFLRQIASQVGLTEDGRRIEAQPGVVRNETDAAALCALLEAPTRRLPVLVLSGDERAADPNVPLLDAHELASGLLGLAHCLVVPSRYTYSLSDEFGRLRSVYHGAARLYWPGFDSAVNPYEHPLLLREQLLRDPAAADREIRALIAADSLRRWRLGNEIPTFSSVRDAVRALERDALSRQGSSAEQRVNAAEARVRELEIEVNKARGDAEFRELLRAELEEKNNKRVAALEQEVEQLRAALERAGATQDDRSALPAAWDSFADWCDATLAGRVVLAAPLRKKLKKALFEDVALAARCLLWLADTCLPLRLKGGGGSVEGPLPEDAGIRNTPCGNDAFDFHFYGRKLSADWHIKTGGNTRAPERCLRIYYGFDVSSGQIVVADMPAHRVTGAT